MKLKKDLELNVIQQNRKMEINNRIMKLIEPGNNREEQHKKIDKLKSQAKKVQRQVKKEEKAQEKIEKEL